MAAWTASRRRKDEVESVACRSALERTVSRERLADEPMVIRKRLGIAIAECLEQARRALDVGEHQGDGSRRQAGLIGLVRRQRDSHDYSIGLMAWWQLLSGSENVAIQAPGASILPPLPVGDPGAAVYEIWRYSSGQITTQRTITFKP